MSDLETLEKDIKSVLITSPGGMTLQQFEFEYISLVGYEIEPFEYGFDSLQSLLRSFAKSITFDGSIFRSITDSSTNHLAALIAKQKKPKAKRGGKFGRGGQPTQRRSVFYKHNYHNSNNHHRQQPFSTFPNSSYNQQSALDVLCSDMSNLQLNSLPLHEERNQDSWNSRCQQFERRTEVQNRSNRTDAQSNCSWGSGNKNGMPHSHQKPNNFRGSAATFDQINYSESLSSNTRSFNHRAKIEKMSYVHKPKNGGQPSHHHRAQLSTFEPANYAALSFNKSQSSHRAKSYRDSDFRNRKKSIALGPNNGNQSRNFRARGFADSRHSHQVPRPSMEFVRGREFRENSDNFSSTTSESVSVVSSISKDANKFVCTPEMIEVAIDELSAALFGGSEFDQASAYINFKRFHNKKLKTKKFGCPDVFDLVAKYGARRNMFVGRYSNGSKFIYYSADSDPSWLTLSSQFPVVSTNDNYPQIHRPRPFFIGILSSFDNIDLFHMQDASNFEFGDRMRQEMLVSYQSYLRIYDNSQVIPWAVGSPCVLINNNTVHRCRIQQLPRFDDDAYVLLQVDNGQLIRTDEPIFPLLQKFVDFPPQAIPCCFKHTGKPDALLHNDKFNRLVEQLLSNADCQCRCLGFNRNKLEIEILVSRDVFEIARALTAAH